MTLKPKRGKSLHRITIDLPYSCRICDYISQLKGHNKNTDRWLDFIRSLAEELDEEVFAEQGWWYSPCIGTRIEGRKYHCRVFNARRNFKEDIQQLIKDYFTSALRFYWERLHESIQSEF